MTGAAAFFAWFVARRDEARLAILLLTRIPMGRIANPPVLSAAIWAYPIAGAIAGAFGGLAYGLASGIGLEPGVAAILAATVMVLVTGGMHEDGLADLADGFGGGATRARKLEIMRDSRIGAYGVIALVLALGLRITLLADMPAGNATVMALIGLGAFSRAILPVLMIGLPQARETGLAAHAADLATSRRVIVAGLIGVLTVIFCLPAAGLVIAVMGVVAVVMSMIALRQIGGVTGDVLGATQVMCELAGWMVLAALS